MPIQRNTLTSRHCWRTLHIGKLIVLFVSLLCMCLSTAVFSPSALAASTGSTPPLKRATFTLDGVTVNIATPFLPGQFTISKPGDATQTATAGTPGFNVHPYGAIYVTAVPFGTKPRTESVPIAQTGSAPIYRMSLYQYRVREGNNPQPGPVITLFGQHVTGEASLMLGDVKQAFSSTVVIEWVVEAGKRIWIVRITQEQPLGTVNLKSATSLLDSLSSLKLTSSTLSHVTTVRASGIKNNAALANYPLAPWWNGPCSNNLNDTGGVGTPSGTSSQANWHGINACYDPTNVPDANITFNVTSNNVTYSGSLSEWECVELVERYFLVAGLLSHTYGANGVNIVTAYPASNMDKVTNGTAGRAPQAGDVLSYNNPTNANGHTALVTGSNVNGSGNGTITILQQNSYTNGNPFPTDTLTVSNWQVINDWNATITGWLDPNSGGTPPSSTIAHPAVDYNTSLNHPEAFALAANDKTMWNDWADAGGGWAHWSQTQATPSFQGSPAVVWDASLGHSEIFAIATDGTMWTDYVDAGGGWAHWFQTQGGLTFQGSPAAIYNPSLGHSEIFAIRSDGTMWADYVDSGGGWAHWFQTQGGLTFQGSPAVVYNTSLGHDELFAIATDGTMWTDYVDAGGGWAHWFQTQGGLTFQGSPAAIYNPSLGHSEIFAIATDGTMWADYADSNGGWAHWFQTQGGLTFQGSPAAIFDTGLGHDELFAIATDGTMWTDYVDAGGGWAHWFQTQGGLTFQGSPAVVYNTSVNHPEVLAIGSGNGTVWQDWPDSGGGWANWSQTQAGLSFY